MWTVAGVGFGIALVLAAVVVALGEVKNELVDIVCVLRDARTEMTKLRFAIEKAINKYPPLE